MAHPSIRLLGRMLAHRGLHVLRFDWYGTGDSGGYLVEGGEPDSWLEDLEVAIDELKALSQVSTVAIVGLRLGAVAAARAARKRREVNALVLWDPIFDGDAYVEELFQASSPGGHGDLVGPHDELTVGVQGFPLTPAMQRSIRSVRLEDSLGPPLPRTQIVSTLDNPSYYDPLRRHFQEVGVDFTDSVMNGPRAWLEEGDFATAGMPVGALRAMAEWLS